METHKSANRVSQTMSAGLDHSEEVLPEVDEPPDEKKSTSTFWPTFKPVPRLGSLAKSVAPNERRESLLTRQLQSETEHTEDEEHIKSPLRGLSMVSTRSNASTASTAELTSDDGKSVVSPAISPPLPPTQVHTSGQVKFHALADEPKIVGQDGSTSPTNTAPAPQSEKTVEAALGRRRCITFGCAAKDKPNAPPTPSKEPETTAPTSPPKRKCMLKFVCPTRSTAEKPAVVEPQRPKRAVSPPPRPPAAEPRPPSHKAHRGSDSTVTHASPKSLRKSPSLHETLPEVPRRRRFSNDSDEAAPEGARFHEFGTSEDEPEEWTQQATCHRSRLTISDTLAKENVIRKLAEEAEDEELEEVDEDDEDDDDAVLDDDDEENEDGDDDDLDITAEDEDESDEGFHSDDEEGFANSDAESDASEDDWWRPGGMSTAATSAEHLDKVTWHSKGDRRFSDASNASESSVGYRSGRSASKSVSEKRLRPRKAINIDTVGANDLPDSTDFVCGTLDEDRPLEQAYINHVKKKQLARHRSVPQDIDPTFPASDPEVMDEEDDEDIEDPPESEAEPLGLMHGEMEELDEPQRRRSSQLRRSIAGRSPPPQIRHRSPPPPRRSVHVSPPPPARHRSPAPRRSIQQSPPTTARHRSPAPRPSIQLTSPKRKLFGQSERRLRSPPPAGRMTSPPNSRASSITGETSGPVAHRGLGGRPSVNVTHTASLPRNGVFQINKLATMEDRDDDDGSDTAANAAVEVPKRGAIDIVKGLEKKRLRRKEKMYQKHCAKVANKGEKPYKVKPGKGAERMREVGLELQRYHGKGIHILSL